MMKPLKSIRGSIDGIVYLIGSGAQLNDLDPGQFSHATTITMNKVPLCWPIQPTYALTKYHEDARSLIDHGFATIVARGDRGIEPDGDPPAGTTFVFDHLPLPAGWDFDLDRHWPGGENELVNAQTVAMTGLHLAAYLGAKCVVMIACGGNGHVAGYYTPEEQAGQRPWLDRVRPYVRTVAGHVSRVYGVVVEGVP